MAGSKKLGIYGSSNGSSIRQRNRRRALREFAHFRALAIVLSSKTTADQVEQRCGGLFVAIVAVAFLRAAGGGSEKGFAVE